MFSRIRKLYKKYIKQGIMREEIIEPIPLPLSDYMAGYYDNTTVTRHVDTVTFSGISSRIEGYQVPAEDDPLRSSHYVDAWRYCTSVQDEGYYLERYEVAPNVYTIPHINCYIRDDIGFWLGSYHARVIRNASFLGYIIVLQRRGKEDVVIKISDKDLFNINDNIFNLSELLLLNKKVTNVVDEICKKLEHEEAILIKLGLGN